MIEILEFDERLTGNLWEMIATNVEPQQVPATNISSPAPDTHNIIIVGGAAHKKSHFYLKNPIRIRNYSLVKEVLTDKSDKYSYKTRVQTNSTFMGLSPVKSGFFLAAPLTEKQDNTTKYCN